MLDRAPSGRATAALLISADELARLLGRSPTHVRRFHSGGKLPKPVMFGRLTRWRDAEVRSWIEAGAPSGYAWHWTRGAA